MKKQSSDKDSQLSQDFSEKDIAGFELTRGFSVQEPHKDQIEEMDSLSEEEEDVEYF